MRSASQVGSGTVLRDRLDFGVLDSHRPSFRFLVRRTLIAHRVVAEPSALAGPVVNERSRISNPEFSDARSPLYARKLTISP